MSAIDVVRVIVLIEGLLSVYLSVMTLIYFFRRKPHPALVFHVRRVTITYIGFVVYGCVEMITHFGESIRWQTFAILTVFTMAAMSQVTLLKFEKTVCKANVCHLIDSPKCVIISTQP